MDPYEYLFQKLGIISLYNTYYETQNIYTDSILCYGPLPGNWNAKRIFNHLRNIKKGCYYCGVTLVELTKLLRLFPDELESIEHVDLLLTLQGMNKGA